MVGWLLAIFPSNWNGWSVDELFFAEVETTNQKIMNGANAGVGSKGIDMETFPQDNHYFRL